MPQEQDLGHAPSPVDGWARVLRVLEQAVGVRIGERCAGIAQSTRQKPDHSVGDHHRRQLASREHIVADADLVRH
jgi:hypothetical protein